VRAARLKGSDETTDQDQRVCKQEEPRAGLATNHYRLTFSVSGSIGPSTMLRSHARTELLIEATNLISTGAKNDIDFKTNSHKHNSEPYR
jgi:hypothetical protein